MLLQACKLLQVCQLHLRREGGGGGKGVGWGKEEGAEEGTGVGCCASPCQGEEKMMRIRTRLGGEVMREVRELVREMREVRE